MTAMDNIVTELLLMEHQQDCVSSLDLYDQDFSDIVPQPIQPQWESDFLPGSPAPEAKLSLFHWQICRELRKVQHLPPDRLWAQDEDGDTLLHIVVAQGRRALSFVLAAKMAGMGFLDIKEHNQQTALQVAVAGDQHLIVYDLLTLGALMNTLDVWGRSPLHVCAEKGHLLSLQSIHKFRTERGQPVDLELLSYDGLTPLQAATISHNAVVKETRNSGRNEQLEQKKEILAQCVQTLLVMGASCGTRDPKSGRTCVHMASEEANVELLDIFLHQAETPTFINAQMFSGNTALHIVCSLRSPEFKATAVKMLMKGGANPDIKNLENELPLQLVPAGPAGKKVRRILGEP